MDNFLLNERLKLSERERDALCMANMRRYGGSFVRSLAIAAQHADPDNLAALKGAFADIWQFYTVMDTIPTAEQRTKEGK